MIMEGLVNKYLFVVPVCAKGSGACERMRKCMTAAKGLAESGNVVKLVLGDGVILPLEGSVAVSCGDTSVAAEEKKGVHFLKGDRELSSYRAYLEKGYALIRF